MYRVLYILILFVIFPVSAQDRFITLDWQKLPAAQTLPEYTENIPLPDDFRFYTYKVKIEFPEFVDLDSEAAAELMQKKVVLPDYPRAETSVGISAHEGILSVRLVPVVYRGGVYQRINSFKLSLICTPVAAATRANYAVSKTTEKSVLSSGRFVKIRVSDSGVYRITNAELSKMGFSNPDKVRLYGYGGYLLSKRFSEHPADDLPEVPLYRGGGGVLFYARGTVSWEKSGNTFTRIKNFYSDYAYYFLTENDESPAEFPVEDGTGSSVNRIENFDAYALYEKDAYSWSDSGRELYDSYDYSVGNSQSYSFNLPSITDEVGRIRVAFSAKSAVNTSLAVAIDGKDISALTISRIDPNGTDAYYEKAVEAVLDNKWEGSKSESTKVTLTHNRAAGIPGRLNYIVLNYKQRLQMNGAYLAFRSVESQDKESTFVISGANTSTVVWDVTSPSEYKQMKGTLTGDTYSFTIPANGTLREFVAVNTSASFGGVESMGEVPNQNLHALKGINMVIIVPDRAAFVQQAERLAQAHREKDGLTVEVVKAPQVYNEFSSGTPDATAYRRLMKMLYDRSTSTDDSRLKYLLLFGDCSYDNRMVTSSWKSYKPSDFLLCYQFENSVDETQSFMTDDYFGFLDDGDTASPSTDLVDIGIGRFPVRTVEEATAAVDKTIDYMNNVNAGTWKRMACFVADDAAGKSDSNKFMTQACDLANKVYANCPVMRAERILADAYKRESSATGITYPQATKRLLQLLEQGVLLLNYTGHSGTTSWAEEKLLTSADIVKLSSPRLPIWFTASCEFTRFDASESSAGELAFLNEKGGAIALVSASRVVYDSPNNSLNDAFIEYFFTSQGGERLRLGDIVRLSKAKAKDNGKDGNKMNFNLIGDPALMPAYPDYKVEVDEFDGPLTNEWPYVKAGAKVTIKGHILTPEGEPADDFTGTIHPLVYDSKETVSTLDGVGEGAVTYTDHMKTLFSGMDSVRNGRFELTFPVPLDINYSNGQGLLNFYACDANKREAGGVFSNFLVGGTADDLPTEGEGPKMMLYLNTPDFPWGGQVNETPYFVAELEDEDGINTVGNGIGHDLSLCIDGKTTYSLNDYYTPVAGSYTKGTVAFSIPTLSEGKHSLVFRAWDIMNHSSVQTLDFEVVNGLRPGLFSITCSKSPARESTTFILSHDRPGSDINVRIVVCDFAGRELWVHTEQGIPSGDYYYVDWDLCSSVGQRLSPGIYLYRASITSGGSKESTKTEKIVILAQ
ncbi:type IX secretion system sortase PorU [Bacteroides sp.]